MRPLWTFWAALVIAAFGLNWLWEFLQCPAFDRLGGLPWAQRPLACAVAALGDVAVTLGIYAVGALATGRLRWVMEAKWNACAAAALLGAACAVAIEWRARAFGLWAYTDWMPIVPGLGIGLWPLLQLTALVPAAFWIATGTGRRAALRNTTH